MVRTMIADRNPGAAHAGGTVLRPQGATIFCASEDGDAVCLIDAATDRVRLTVETGYSVWSMCVTGTRVYLSLYNRDSLLAIDTSCTGVVGATRGLGELMASTIITSVASSTA